MKGLRHLISPLFIIFFLVFAMVGVTYAWVSIGLLGMSEGYYSLAELKGTLDTEDYTVVPGGIKNGESYEHVITIENTSTNAGVHLRANLSWIWQDQSGTQVAIPRDLIDVALTDGDGDWTWVKLGDGSWIREHKSEVSSDGTKKRYILPKGSSLKVIMKATALDELSDYDTEDLDLRFRFVVEMEGELVYRSYE